MPSLAARLVAATLLPMSALAAPAPSLESSAAPGAYAYIHHPVSTDNPAAQFAFDRGLTMIFAYQPEEAERAFREAARLDPSLAMSWWGVGLSLGPNINEEPTPEKTNTAVEALARAHLLAEQRATGNEREYVAALTARYTTAPAAAILGSRLAEARRRTPEAIELLRLAVKLQDNMPYSEPPPWFYPVRESLGALLLRHGAAAEAQAVFAESLRRSPRDPRALFGLSAALTAQGQKTAAAAEKARFAAAWRLSDGPLAIEDL